MNVLSSQDLSPNIETNSRKQRTLKHEAVFSGIGLHTGTEVNMRFCPAAAGTGIQFKRVDLPGQPVIPAGLEYVVDTNRSTTLGLNDVRIHTVEHVLAAFYAYRIDNVIIEIDSIEPPIADGSSAEFVTLIEQCVPIEQDEWTPVVTLSQPVYWSNDEVHLVALPANEFKISYTLHYPQNEILRAQYHSETITAETFKKEIAPCRTFSLYEEISFLMDKGLIKGGSLSNAVVIKGDVILSKEGLKFPNEMARHKLLDVVGDLSLVGLPFHAHVIAIRSGHGANCAFAKLLLRQLTKEKA